MRSNLLDSVDRFIARERLLQPRQHVFVAVSGGIDSMVLLHALRCLRHPCTVLHVNHGLRGAESDADESFVRQQCEAEGIPFQTKKVDVEAFKEEEPVSTQMAARYLRYEWFSEAMGEYGKHRCALGHHEGDLIETLFINLLRGTGRRGWGNMAPRRADFVRPLLCVQRAEIEDYAKEHGVAWREDQSNASMHYQRNRIRHELLPLLEQIRPGALRTIGRSAHLLRHLTRMGNQEVLRMAARKVPQPDGSYALHFKDLEQDEHAFMHLYALMRAHGFHPDLAERLHDAIAQRITGAEFRNERCRIVVDREALIVQWVDQHDAQWIRIALGAGPGQAHGFTWGIEAGPPTAVPPNLQEVLLDADRLEEPLLLRPWRPGDRMRPIGLGGSKLISDILIDAKVPRTMKDLTHVLVSGGEVVWLVGHRIAEGYQATTNTERVLRIHRA